MRDSGYYEGIKGRFFLLRIILGVVRNNIKGIYYIEVFINLFFLYKDLIIVLRNIKKYIFYFYLILIYVYNYSF